MAIGIYTEEDLLNELQRREEAKIHMRNFVPYVTEGMHMPAPHHRIICDALDRAVRGKVQRLIIAAPPAHAKSVYTSHNFPAFWLGNHPKDKIIAASHTQPFAAEIGGKVRSLVGNPLYKQLFELEVSADTRAKDRWDTTAGGEYYTTGVNGTVVGRRANLILIDDPYKSKQLAYSPGERKKISDWYFTDVEPRLLPGGVVIVIATRWHEDDLSGELLKKSEKGDIEPFELISLPAICEDPENDPMGRAYGEALWPSQYPLERLRKLESGMPDPDEWNALFQQKPKPSATGEIKSEWFGKFDKLPNDEPYLRIVSWDTAGTTNERSDYTVGLAISIGLKSRHFFITDMYREKREFHNLMRDIPAFNNKGEPAHAVLIENKGTGTSLIQVLRNAGQNIIPIAPQKLGDKEFRFELAVPAMEGGRVHIPRKAPWTAQFLEEILTFPGGQHDDVVDAFSQAINHYGSRGRRRGLAPLRGA
jgi:predicted phage terminase large subunit-like protein